MSPRVIDLFSGVGGLSLGFQQEGFEIPLANEYDTEIAESYKINHPGTRMITEDISKIDLESTFSDFHGIDGIVGGPPCQGYSQKGKRRTVNDPRNFLFRSFIDVVRIVEPKFFVMENVPNLLTSSNGFFANEIREMFANLGYSISVQVALASLFGVPQNRRRAIIIGTRNQPAPELDSRSTETITIWDAISDLNFLESGEGKFRQEYPYAPLSEYQNKLRANSAYLFNHQATNHSKLAIERMKIVKEGQGKDALPEHHLTKSIHSGTWGRMNRLEQSVTITTRFETPSSGKFTHPERHRAITVREAARLQSFPDDFVFYGSKGSQMKQVGNAVPPRLARSIARTILEGGVL